jgi:probable phosphoglycerate mutase
MLYFVRHGQSVANVKQVFAGAGDDSPLTDLGRGQARQAAQDLQGVGITRIVSSPLSRAKETAAIIAAEIAFDPAAVTIDPRIIEQDVGVMAGKPWDSVDAVGLQAVEGVESAQHMQARILAFLRDHHQDEGITLMVSHGGVGQMIVATQDDIDPSLFNDLPSVPNAKAVLLDLSWLKR